LKKLQTVEAALSDLSTTKNDSKEITVVLQSLYQAYQQAQQESQPGSTGGSTAAAGAGKAPPPK
jgi:hypothetical protein